MAVQGLHGAVHCTRLERLQARLGRVGSSPDLRVNMMMAHNRVSSFWNVMKL